MGGPPVKVFFWSTQHTLFPTLECTPPGPLGFIDIGQFALKQLVCALVNFLYKPVNFPPEFRDCVRQSGFICVGQGHQLICSLLFFWRSTGSCLGRENARVKAQKHIEARQTTLTGHLICLPRLRSATCIARIVNLASIGDRFTLITRCTDSGSSMRCAQSRALFFSSSVTVLASSRIFLLTRSIRWWQAWTIPRTSVAYGPSGNTRSAYFPVTTAVDILPVSDTLRWSCL